ncbi:hypothetical protein [Aquisphaera insulae]|uniref:hypothetical protein n=1 Tax=Aquisphaera insulae TaxID=2712864 RepID=UPI0013EDBF6F|nr:hypothetical protein [Aquisphaera insulae]
MKLRFTCPTCGKPHTIDASLAGKMGRCKDCGVTIRIPGARSSAPTMPKFEERFGLDDEPASPPAAVAMPPRREAEVDDEPVPRRVKPSGKGKKRRAGEPWNLTLRGQACLFTGAMVAGMIGGIGLMIPPATRMIGGIVYLIAMVISVPAILLTVVSVIGAFISFLGGNRRAFAGESGGGQAAWILSITACAGLSAIWIGALPTAIHAAREAARRAQEQQAAASVQKEIQSQQEAVDQFRREMMQHSAAPRRFPGGPRNGFPEAVR